MKTLNKFILLAGGQKAVPASTIKEMWMDGSDPKKTMLYDHLDQFIGVVDMNIKDIIAHFNN